MSKLETVRSKLDKKLFTTDQLGSEVTITPVTKSEGSYGGYSGDSESDGTSVDTVAVPYSRVSSRVNFQGFGDLQEGEIQIVFRYDEDLDYDYKVTFDGTTYRIREIREIPLNTGTAAVVVLLSKNKS